MSVVRHHHTDTGVTAAYADAQQSVAPGWRSASVAAMPPLKPRPPATSKRQRYVRDVYSAAARARWIDQIVAPTAEEAIKAAAVEFKAEAWKLIAVRRYEIA